MCSSKKKEVKNQSPPKWGTKWAYRLLAAGRYAALWAPELWALYKQMLDDEGEQKANEWLMRELLHSVGPSIAIRVYRVLRVIYAAYTAYRKLAGD